MIDLNPETSASWRAHYSLDPDIAYLNHGSFGAVPIPVQKDFQAWHRKIEANPVDFMVSVVPEGTDKARAALAGFVGVPAKQLAFITNATMGVNIFARALRLSAGDEVLATSQEYGATQKAMQYWARQVGAGYRIQEVPFPATDKEEWLDTFWKGVTPATKALFFSHITSPTAFTLPMEELCARARAEGIATVVDGAHAPGNIDLSLEQAGVDFYTGNCHKWLSSPRGTGFIYVNECFNKQLEPLVVSHGWGPDARSDDPVQEYVNYQGTIDPCARLSVPAAIRFLKDLPMQEARKRNHALAQSTRQAIADLFGMPTTCTDDQGWFSQMVTAWLPPGSAEKIKDRLWAKYRIIIPLGSAQGVDLVRISVKEYNSVEDLDRLVEALRAELI